MIHVQKARLIFMSGSLPVVMHMVRQVDANWRLKREFQSVLAAVNHQLLKRFGIPFRNHSCEPQSRSPLSRMESIESVTILQSIIEGRLHQRSTACLPMQSNVHLATSTRNQG
jgi:hypothetical protein